MGGGGNRPGHILRPSPIQLEAICILIFLISLHTSFQQCLFRGHTHMYCGLFRFVFRRGVSCRAVPCVKSRCVCCR